MIEASIVTMQKTLAENSRILGFCPVELSSLNFHVHALHRGINANSDSLIRRGWRIPSVAGAASLCVQEQDGRAGTGHPLCLKRRWEQLPPRAVEL